jgi:hypothetical protein
MVPFDSSKNGAVRKMQKKFDRTTVSQSSFGLFPVTAHPLRMMRHPRRRRDGKAVF